MRTSVRLALSYRPQADRRITKTLVLLRLTESLTRALLRLGLTSPRLALITSQLRRSIPRISSDAISRLPLNMRSIHVLRENTPARRVRPLDLTTIQSLPDSEERLRLRIQQRTTRTTSTPRIVSNEMRGLRLLSARPGAPHAAATASDGSSTRSSGMTSAASGEPDG